MNPPERTRAQRSRLTPEAEASLRVSDAIIEISSDAIISVDAQQRIVRFNRGAEEIFGYAAHEVLGRPLDILLPERFRGTHGAHIVRFGEGPVTSRRMGERRQIAGQRASGEEFPAEASISKVDVAGERIYTVVLRDITERQRVEQSQRFLAQAGELLATTLDTSRTIEGVARLALPLLGDGCTILLHEEGESLRRTVCAHRDPALAQQMQAWLATPFQSAPGNPAAQALASGEPQLLPRIEPDDLTAWAASEEYLQFLRGLDPRSLIAVPIHVRGRAVGVATFFFDGRNLRSHDADDLALAQELARRMGLALDNAQLYAQAQRAVRARDDVLAVVSHDLGNPLTAIRVSASVLLRQSAHQRDEQMDRKQIENIRASVDQMERLIRDLLDIKRIEAGLLSLEQETCPVSAIVRDVADVAEHWLQDRTLRVELDDLSGDLSVYADPQRVLQVFSNLIGNAARFAPIGSAIGLRVRRQQDEIVFSISDSGPGIPAEHLPHLFDRFWQARRTGRHGMGLGLAIVKGIVETHGGRVWAESELGAGSTFYFTLPAHTPTA